MGSTRNPTICSQYQAIEELPMSSEDRTFVDGSSSVSNVNATSYTAESASAELNKLFKDTSHVSLDHYQKLMAPLDSATESAYTQAFDSGLLIIRPGKPEETDFITASFNSQERKKASDMRQRAHWNRSGESGTGSFGGTSLRALTEEPGTMDDEGPKK